MELLPSPTAIQHHLGAAEVVVVLERQVVSFQSLLGSSSMQARFKHLAVTAVTAVTGQSAQFPKQVQVEAVEAVEARLGQEASSSWFFQPLPIQERKV